MPPVIKVKMGVSKVLDAGERKHSVEINNFKLAISQTFKLIHDILTTITFIFLLITFFAALFKTKLITVSIKCPNFYSYGRT